MKLINPKSMEKGFTLIEIMIALLLGAFLIGGVLQIFLNTRQTYRMQENLSRLQENGRFAMEFIGRDLRMADYWGCISSADIENKLNASTYDAFSNGITGQENDNGGNDGDNDNDENNNNVWDGTDTFTIRGSGGSEINIKQQPTTTAAVLKVKNNSGLAQNDIVIISNCIAGDIFQITNVTSGGGFDNIVHNTGTGTPGNASQRLEIGPEPTTPQPNTNRYGPDSKITRLNFISYKIDNGSGNQPSLFRSINGSAYNELIEGIENMQILYGVDTNDDGTPNHYIDASTVPDWSKVISTRITLTARTLNNNFTQTGDGRLRRKFTSTIVLRNRLKL